MKKKLSFLLAAALTFSLLYAVAGCEKKDKDKKGSEEQITITYGGWENVLLASEWTKKFTEKHPNIKVEIAEPGKWLGTNQLVQLAATDRMPDIINVENIFTPVKNKWLIDIKKYYDADTEKRTYSNFEQYGTFDSKLLLLPSNVFTYGVKVNLDLLEANNIPKPGYNWTIDDFMGIMKKVTQKGESAGASDIRWLMKHYAAQANHALSWASFDTATRKYLLGDEWIKSVNMMKEVYDNKYTVWEHIDAMGMPQEMQDGPEKDNLVKQRDNYLKNAIGSTDDPWPSGRVAFAPDFSWVNKFDKIDPLYTGFNWDYYPFPAAKAGEASRPGLSIDFFGITASCKNPEAAFELIKYMSYDLEGYKDKVEIVKNYDKNEYLKKYPKLDPALFTDELVSLSIPPINDPAAIEEWKKMDPGFKPGMEEILKNMNNGYVDLWRLVPVYESSWEGTLTKTIIEQVFTGKKTAADLAKELETTINKFAAEGYAEMEAAAKEAK